MRSFQPTCSEFPRTDFNLLLSGKIHSDFVWPNPILVNFRSEAQFKRISMMMIYCYAKSHTHTSIARIDFPWLVKWLYNLNAHLKVSWACIEQSNVCNWKVVRNLECRTLLSKITNICPFHSIFTLSTSFVSNIGISELSMETWCKKLPLLQHVSAPFVSSLFLSFCLLLSNSIHSRLKFH